MRRLILLVISSLVMVVVAGAPANADIVWSATPSDAFEGAANVSSVADMVPDGSGNFYVGGSFEKVDGITVWSIAKYTPSTDTWAALGGGLKSGMGMGRVIDLDVAPDGMLYVAGVFSTAGGKMAVNVAQWNPTTQQWSALGPIPNLAGQGNAVEWHDSKLYFAGAFRYGSYAGKTGIAVWDGASWSPVGGGVDNTVRDIEFDADGNLYVSGMFENAYDTVGGAAVPMNDIAKWDGTHWTSVGVGTAPDLYITRLRWHDGMLFAAGFFTDSRLAASELYVRRAGTWTTIPFPKVAYIYDMNWDANGDLIVGGSFSWPDLNTYSAARWSGSWDGSNWVGAWQRVANFSSTVLSIVPDGQGGLYITGGFTGNSSAGYAGKIAHFTLSHSKLRFSSTAFPTTALGNTEVLTVTVSNIGGLNASLSAPTVTGTRLSDKGTGTCSGSTVLLANAASTCTVVLEWRPIQPGSILNGLLTFGYNDGAARTQSIELTGRTAFSGPLAFGESDFGGVEVGTSKDLTLAIGNMGSLTAPLDSIELFSDDVTRIGGTCAASIPAGGTCTVEFRWTPKSAGAQPDAFVNVSYQNGEWQSEAIFLSGVATAPIAEAEETPVAQTPQTPTLPPATSIPGAVTKLKAHKKGRISWAAPADTGNLPITGYKVAVRTFKAKKFRTVATVTKTSYTFRKLKPGKYVAQVTSMNSMGGLLPVTVKFTMAKRKR